MLRPGPGEQPQPGFRRLPPGCSGWWQERRALPEAVARAPHCPVSVLQTAAWTGQGHSLGSLGCRDTSKSRWVWASRKPCLLGLAWSPTPILPTGYFRATRRGEAGAKQVNWHSQPCQCCPRQSQLRTQAGPAWDAGPGPSIMGAVGAHVLRARPTHPQGLEGPKRVLKPGWYSLTWLYSPEPPTVTTCVSQPIPSPQSGVPQRPPFGRLRTLLGLSSPVL